MNSATRNFRCAPNLCCIAVILDRTLVPVSALKSTGTGHVTGAVAALAPTVALDLTEFFDEAEVAVEVRSFTVFSAACAWIKFKSHSMHKERNSGLQRLLRRLQGAELGLFHTLDGRDFSAETG